MKIEFDLANPECDPLEIFKDFLSWCRLQKYTFTYFKNEALERYIIVKSVGNIPFIWVKEEKAFDIRWIKKIRDQYTNLWWEAGLISKVSWNEWVVEDIKSSDKT
jgi:hypothetical protein